MEFKLNKFTHRSVDFINQSFDSRFGLIKVLQVENYDSSDFLTCFKPERFQIRHVFFSFPDVDDVFSYYEVLYNDPIVNFHLFFKDFIYLNLFFVHYDDDYNLHFALNKVFHGNSYMCTHNDCLSLIYSVSSRESSDVLEPVTESEQQGLLSDELPF